MRLPNVAFLMSTPTGRKTLFLALVAGAGLGVAVGIIINVILEHTSPFAAFWPALASYFASSMISMRELLARAMMPLKMIADTDLRAAPLARAAFTDLATEFQRIDKFF